MADPLPLTRTTTLAGRTIGRLAYGCWRFERGAGGAGRAAARAKMDAALSIGANLIDTAAIYGFGANGFGDAEAGLGDLLADDAALRDQIVLVSKGGIEPPMPYDSRADSLIASARASLKRLRTDRMEVFLIHRPDLLAHPAEMAQALSTLRAAGDIIEAGVSNFTPAQTRTLQAHLDFDLAVTQPEVSVLCEDALVDGTLDLAMERGMTPMAWSPLAGGRLFAAPQTDADARVRAALDAVDDDRSAVALAWLLAHPAGLVPIIGSQDPDRIRASAAAYDVTLTRRDWYAILEALRGEAMP